MRESGRARQDILEQTAHTQYPIPNTQSRSAMRRFGPGLLRVAVSVGLLAFLLTQVDLWEIVTTLAGADLPLLGAALALYLAGVVLRAYRWQGLIQALGYPASLSRLTVLYFVGTFFSNLLPTGVGGDVVRAFEAARDGAGAASAASSVLVDRATGLLTLLAMALVALIPGYQLVTPQVAALIVVVCLGTFAGVGLLAWVTRPHATKEERLTEGEASVWARQVTRPHAPPSLGEAIASGRVPVCPRGRPRTAATDRQARQADRWRVLLERLPGVTFLARRRGLRDFYHSFRAYGRPALVRALALSLLFNVLLIVVNLLLAWAVGVWVSPWYFVLFVPIISFTLLLPISLSGLGVREGAYVLLFAQAGVPAALALAISLAFYALNVVTGLIGGVMYAVGIKG